jgi:hypothetical protein
MTTSSTRHMHKTSIDSDGQYGYGLPNPLDSHNTNDESDSKAASKMSNTQNTHGHVPKTTYKLESPLDTQNPVHTALDIVSPKLHQTHSKPHH